MSRQINRRSFIKSVGFLVGSELLLLKTDSGEASNLTPSIYPSGKTDPGPISPDLGQQFSISKEISDGIFVFTNYEKYTARSYYTLMFAVHTKDGFLAGDSVSIVFPMLLQYRGWSKPQICTPTGEGYTSIFLNGKDVTRHSLSFFDAASAYSMQQSMKYSFSDNIPGNASIVFVYGDRSKGSFGARCQVLPVNTQTGGYKPIKIIHSRQGQDDRTGKYYFDVNPEDSDRIECLQRIDELNGLKHVRLGLNRFDFYGNVVKASDTILPLAEYFEGLATGKRIEHDGCTVELWKKIEGDEPPRVKITGNSEKMQAPSNALPMLGPMFNNYSVYYGDLHVHCGDVSGDALGSFDEIFQYARDIAGLDFIAMTDHAENYNPDLYRRYLDKTEQYNNPGVFITFPGFEWTRNFSYGHKNVVFKDTPLPLPISPFEKSDLPWAETPGQLWKLLENSDALSTPHFPMPTYTQIETEYPLAIPLYNALNLKSDHHQADWKYRNTRFQRLVEITSRWGKYLKDTLFDHPQLTEFIFDIEERANGVQEALKQGQILGFIGSSDQHSGRPGDGGVAGVLAFEKTRDGIWEALKSRRTFAATKQGMILCMKVNDHLMGSELTHNACPPVISIEASGTDAIKTLEIVKISDGTVSVIADYSPMALHCAISFSDDSLTGKVNIYYSRFKQSDGEKAWSSPVWLKAV